MSTQAVDHAETVEPRQHQVDDDDVGLALERQRQTFFSVSSDVDGIARFPQAPCDEVGYGPIVLDDEGVHGSIGP